MERTTNGLRAVRPPTVFPSCFMACSKAGASREQNFDIQVYKEVVRKKVTQCYTQTAMHAINFMNYDSESISDATATQMKAPLFPIVTFSHAPESSRWYSR